MHINTKTKETMKQSIYQILNINNIQLDELLEDCYKQLQYNRQVFILDDQYDYFKSYVQEHLITEINEVLFVHLGRRLDNDNNGYNLIDVLTKQTSLSIYLKEYGLTFKYDQDFKMYVDGIEMDLDAYFKQRLNHDSSFTGYAFMDEIKDSHYYEDTIGGPEFFGHLYSLGIDDDKLIDNYINQSNFYQFSYLVPIKDIYFENYEELDEKENGYHIVVKTLQRLYFDKYDPIFNHDHHVVIGMINNETLVDKYLIEKTEV